MLFMKQCFIFPLIIAITIDGFFYIQPLTRNRSPSVTYNTLIRSSIVIPSNPRQIDVGEGRTHFTRTGLNKHDLLTAADEFALSKQFKLGANIQDQAKAMTLELGRNVTVEDLSNVLEIPTKTVVTLIEKGKMAKNKLVRANMRLVFHIANYYKTRGVAYPDLIQEGTVGLIKAVEKYDADRGFRFSTYASWWIKQAISRAVAEKSRIVRLPVHIHDLMVSMSKMEKLFVKENGRKPSSAELAERLGLPAQKIELLMKSRRDVNSMDVDAYKQKSGVNTGSEVQVRDRLVSEKEDPGKVNSMASLREETRRSIDKLTMREAQILELRFGLVDGHPQTLEEIGRRFDVTRERVRQIESRALSKLRDPTQAGDFKEIFQDHSLEEELLRVAEAAKLLAETIEGCSPDLSSPDLAEIINQMEPNTLNFLNIMMKEAKRMNVTV